MQSETLLNRNIEILNKNASRYGIFFNCRDAAGDRCKVVMSKKGVPSVRVLDERENWQTLHSMVDPEKEAQELTRNTKLSEQKTNVILGCGLGYHVITLCLNAGNVPIVIVERNSAVLKEFLSNVDIESLECRNNLVVICAETAEEALGLISSFQLKNSLNSFSVFNHPASFRAYPKFYKTINSAISASNSFNIKDKLRYKKFTGEKARVLILNSRYFLLGEIINTLTILGHELKTLFVEPEGYGDESTISSLLSEIVAFKPDFVLTINHTGFDREGVLCRFFTDIEMPYASWFVDSPLFILENFETNISDYLCCFLWDKNYVQSLQKKGYNHCYYLPLATDPTFFKDIPIHLNPYFSGLMDVSFVGSSLEHSMSKHYDSIDNDPDIIAFLNSLAGKYMLSTAHDVKEYVGELPLNQQNHYNYLKDNGFESIDTALNWKATQLYRTRCIKALGSFYPDIFGDPGWKLYLNGTARLHPEVNYYEELPFVYNASVINFNSTHLQMKGAVNQRVFDVPATGGFLLSDYREQMSDLYEIGREAVCYYDCDDIKDMVRFYLKRPEARQTIVKNAYNRTINCHTYTHRLNSIISTMNRLYCE